MEMKDIFRIDDSVFDTIPYSNVLGSELRLELYSLSSGYAFHEFSIFLQAGRSLSQIIYREVLEQFAVNDISPSGVGVRKAE